MPDSTHLSGGAALSSTEIHHGDRWVRTNDGLRLFEQSWAPESPKAVVVLVHGFAEHSSRHASTALHLARHGYAVQTLDLRGHGRSEGKRCFVRAFDEYLDDTTLLVLSARARWPGRPIYLLGHSLGGLIASLFCIDRPTELSGLILSAPAVKLGRDYSPSKIIACLALGRMFPRLPTVRLRGSSLSRDPSVVRAYDEDELVFHGRTPARTASEIVRAIRRLQANAKRISVPLLVMHGSHDQVAEFEGSKAFCERVQSSDRSLRVCAGLWHEIMHEPEKDAVLQQMMDWLDERTPD
ncbi:MAG: lysophospholipase [Candidatus Eisenbacteria bacterium]|nr:lysophospholipase [Candidatus Eisenbacteria bacterium]